MSGSHDGLVSLWAICATCSSTRFTSRTPRSHQLNEKLTTGRTPPPAVVVASANSMVALSKMIRKPPLTMASPSPSTSQFSVMILTRRDARTSPPSMTSC